MRPLPILPILCLLFLSLAKAQDSAPIFEDSGEPTAEEAAAEEPSEPAELDPIQSGELKPVDSEPVASSPPNEAPETPETSADLVQLWLASYRGLERLEVGFNQQRKLKTLKLPLSTKGWMWMDVGSGRFRWQLGDPPKTVVVGESDRIVIARPKQMKVEYREKGGASSTEGAPPGFSVMADGFPRSIDEFSRQYRVLKVVKQEDHYELHAQPLEGEMAQGVKELIYMIDDKDYFLRGFDFKLKDGSSIRSEFFHVKRNPVIDPRRFTFDDTGYTETTFGPDEE